MTLSYEPGTEKWVTWARKRASELRALRKRLDLPKLQRAWAPATGVLVWVMSTRFGEVIRITGAVGIEFLVLAVGTVPIAGVASGSKSVTSGYIDFGANGTVAVEEGNPAGFFSYDNGFELDGSGVWVADPFAGFTFYDAAAIEAYIGLPVDGLVVTGPEFTLSIAAPTEQALFLRGLRRPAAGQPYERQLTATWTAGSNPWSVDGYPPIAVSHDRLHYPGVTAAVAGGPRRNASLPADTRAVAPLNLAGSDSPGAGVVPYSMASGYLVLADGVPLAAGTRVWVRRLGSGVADTEYPWAAFVARAQAAAAVAAPSRTWTTTHYEAVAYETNQLVLVARMNESPGSEGVMGGNAVYAERVALTSAAGGLSFETTETFSNFDAYSDGWNVRVGEQHLDNGTHQFVYRSALGPGGFVKPVLSQAGAAYENQVTRGLYTSLARPLLPLPYNCPFLGTGSINGDTWSVSTTYSMSRVPTSVSFAGQEIHYGLVSYGMTYVPYFCGVYPVGINIEGTQYWWVNSTSVRSSLVPADTPGLYVYANPGEYVYASPHLYTYKATVLRDGALYHTETQMRTYTANDGLGSEGWDSTQEVPIYIPADGVRIDGQDWICGLRVTQSFGTDGTAFGNAIKYLAYDVAPAMWTPDLSTVHAYPAHGSSVARAFPGTSAGPQQRVPDQLFPYGASAVSFRRYRNTTFLVFQSLAGGVHWYGVGMDAPAEAPVEITDAGDTSVYAELDPVTAAP
jgi:hypothetical protein